MRLQFKIASLIILALTMLTAGTALAEDPPAEMEPATCAGTVVSVDEATGAIKVYQVDGTFCDVTLEDGMYSHPIVALLGEYFDQTAEDVISATDVEELQICVDLTDSCVTTVTVVGVAENSGGGYTITYWDGTTLGTIITDDASLVESLDTALNPLHVDWELDLEGTAIQSGAKIAGYHDDGIGFGVLVKIFIMAAESELNCSSPDGADADPAVDEEPCGVTVEELVELFQSDVGMGELFKIYGKPSMLGVGHIKQALRGGNGKPEWAGPKNNGGDGDVDDGDGSNGDTSGDEDSLAGPSGQQNKDKENGPPTHAWQNKGKKDTPPGLSGQNYGQADLQGQGGQKPKDKPNQPQNSGGKGKGKGKK